MHSYAIPSAALKKCDAKTTNKDDHFPGQSVRLEELADIKIFPALIFLNTYFARSTKQVAHEKECTSPFYYPLPMDMSASQAVSSLLITLSNYISVPNVFVRARTYVETYLQLTKEKLTINTVVALTTSALSLALLWADDNDDAFTLYDWGLLQWLSTTQSDAIRVQEIYASWAKKYDEIIKNNEKKPSIKALNKIFTEISEEYKLPTTSLSELSKTFKNQQLVLLKAFNFSVNPRSMPFINYASEIYLAEESFKSENVLYKRFHALVTQLSGKKYSNFGNEDDEKFYNMLYRQLLPRRNTNLFLFNIENLINESKVNPALNKYSNTEKMLAFFFVTQQCLKKRPMQLARYMQIIESEFPDKFKQDVIYAIHFHIYHFNKSSPIQKPKNRCHCFFTPPPFPAVVDTLEVTPVPTVNTNLTFEYMPVPYFPS